MAGAQQQMARRNWGALTPISRLRDELDELFERFRGDEGDGLPSGLVGPPMDLTETDSALQIRMDIPGVDPQDIDVQVSENRLTISGERKQEIEEKNEKVHRTERRYGRFARSVMLPCPINADKINASFNEGVLSITLPKSEKAKAQRIEVKTK